MSDDEYLSQAIAGNGVIQIAGLLSLLMPAGAVIGFGIKDLDGRYRLANQELERLFGQGMLPLAGKSESDLLPTRLLAPLARGDQSILSGGPAGYEEVDLPVGDKISHCLWLKLPVLGPDRKLQSIASIVYQVAAPTDMQQTLDRLHKVNEELLQTVAELEQLAGTDKLTGAWNRRRLEECVRQEMDRLKRYEQPLSLLVLDIDYFKAINDQHGHGAGDQVLRALTALLQSRLRGTDALARWGGEEFVVLCPNSGRSTVAILAERLREQIADTIFPPVGKLTVSIGAAECTPGETWENWFQRADEALYRAKTGGRNQVQLAPETTQAADVPAYVVANFVQLVWHSAYECGNELVDRGHRRLFADANELLSAMLSTPAAESVDAIIDRLVVDTLQHFGEEEKVLLAAGFPAAEEHMALHRGLVSRARQLVDDYRAGKQGIGDVFQFLAHDLVTRHMLGADRQFFSCLRMNDPAPARQDESKRRERDRTRAGGGWPAPSPAKDSGGAGPA